jgi:RadC-like JAB domain
MASIGNYDHSCDILSKSTSPSSLIDDHVNQSIKEIYNSAIEHIHILYFDDDYTSIARWNYSIGSRSLVPCSADFVIEMALECGAQHFILLHNHPSGNCLPSKADIEFTAYLKAQATKRDLNLIDHIVCSTVGATSILTAAAVERENEAGQMGIRDAKYSTSLAEFARRQGSANDKYGIPDLRPEIAEIKGREPHPLLALGGSWA